MKKSVAEGGQEVCLCLGGSLESFTPFGGQKAQERKIKVTH